MIDQEKRGNAIKALELCTSKIETRTQVPCEICPYHNEKYHGVLGDGCCNAHSLQGDILALLKAQEPRVMTAEDMWTLKFNDTVIIEQKIPSLLIPAIVRDNIKHDDALEVLQVVTASTNGTANADYEYYGKTWRCWTSRPTDAQREKEPWNG